MDERAREPAPYAQKLVNSLMFEVAFETKSGVMSSVGSGPGTRMSRSVAAVTRTLGSASGVTPAGGLSEKGVRLAQNIQVGPCIYMGILVQKAEIGPTSGPTRHLSHFVADQLDDDLGVRAVEVIKC